MSRKARFQILAPLALPTLAPLLALAQTAAFNLPSQPLADSLKAIGEQTSLNIMVSAPLVDGKQAPALKADLSAKEAMTRLLAGTKLEYHFVNEQTVVIREKSQPLAANNPPPVLSPSSELAQDPRTKEGGKKSSQD